jgi:hypothetical protein
MKLDQQACGLVVFAGCGTSRARALKLLQQVAKDGYAAGHGFDYRGVWVLVDGKSLTLQLVWWGFPVPSRFWLDAASRHSWNVVQLVEPVSDALSL